MDSGVTNIMGSDSDTTAYARTCRELAGGVWVGANSAFDMTDIYV